MRIGMAKIILALGEKVLREIPLSKERVTIGRRSLNDIVIDDLAISGEHAVVVTTNHDSFLEDLNSTNGTKVNGQPVRKHYLQHQDCIELASYRLHYTADSVEPTEERGGHGKTDGLAGPRMPGAKVKVLSGAKVGSEIAINKAITTIGKPDLHTAVILWRADGYYLAHVEGTQYPYVNGVLVGTEPQKLSDHDIIDMSGDRMQFLIW